MRNKSHEAFEAPRAGPACRISIKRIDSQEPVRQVRTSDQSTGGKLPIAFNQKNDVNSKKKA